MPKIRCFKLVQGHRHLTLYISACIENILGYFFFHHKKNINCQAGVCDAGANQIFHAC